MGTPEAENMARRLATVRFQSRLGLRTFAEELRERANYKVAHTTVAAFEEGTSDPPVGYLEAVAAAFPGIVPWVGWLLTGKPLVEPGRAEEKLEAIRRIVLDGECGDDVPAVVKADRHVRSMLPRRKTRAGGE